MRVVVAPDSFKGSLNQIEVAQVLAAGLMYGYGGGIEIDECPLSDGGEGGANLWRQQGGESVVRMVPDSWGQPHQTAWLLRNGTAYIESAGASPYGRRPPGAVATTSAGTGALIADALADPRVQQIYVGLGGTGSVDGGLGLLTALGMRCWNAQGGNVSGRIQNAAEVRRVSLPPLTKPVTALADVNAPLLGPSGAVRRFGPQKGLRAPEIVETERVLRHFSETTAPEHIDAFGAGAAGGMGFALRMLGARIESGAQWWAENTGLAQRLARAQVAVTGEGRLDAQTLMGKVPAAVLERAQGMGTRVVLVAGEVPEDPTPFYANGAWLVLSLATGPGTLRQAVRATQTRLFRMGETIGRILR